MKNISLLIGYEDQYQKVQELTDDQKSLVIQALGYALAEHGMWKDEYKETILRTFTSFIKRGLIL